MSSTPRTRAGRIAKRILGRRYSLFTKTYTRGVTASKNLLYPSVTRAASAIVAMTARRVLRDDDSEGT